MLDPASLAGAIADAEVVFHVAGVNEMCTSDAAAMVHANVVGSVNVVRASRAQGVRRVVYTSSAATLGERQGEVGTESSRHRGWYLSNYERSKHLAERAVMALDGVEVVAVNPSSVQGPGRATGTGKILLDVVRGKLPFLVDVPVSIVDIDDCAVGHLAVADRGKPGERYVLNSFTLPIADAVAILKRVTNRNLGVRYLPRQAVSVAGALGGGWSRLSGSTPPLCPEMARTLRHGHRYDGAKAARELGLEYTSPEALISRLVDWFESQGLLEID
jgi:dihydroflavonol-4-reductase